MSTLCFVVSVVLIAKLIFKCHYLPAGMDATRKCCLASETRPHLLRISSINFACCSGSTLCLQSKSIFRVPFELLCIPCSFVSMYLLTSARLNPSACPNVSTSLFSISSASFIRKESSSPVTSCPVTWRRWRKKILVCFIFLKYRSGTISRVGMW